LVPVHKLVHRGLGYQITERKSLAPPRGIAYRDDQADIRARGANHGVLSHRVKPYGLPTAAAEAEFG
jgi:hypothetical protein